MSGDLSNRLRNLAEVNPPKQTLPGGAVIVKCSLEVFTQIKELAGEAADAIEELIEVTQNHEFLESLIKPNWIPVTERLPEDERQVLAYYGFDHGDGYLGMMFVQVLDWFGHDPKPHFQHEGLNGMKVTHWMPLPEPPKEEA